MIGSLLYLTASRPDIMYSVCLCGPSPDPPDRRDSLLKEKKENDMLLVQIYVDDIIFGATKGSACIVSLK